MAPPGESIAIFNLGDLLIAEVLNDALLMSLLHRCLVDAPEKHCIRWDPQ